MYGLAPALGAAALQWLEYQLWTRTHAFEVSIALIATAFLGLGIWVGARRSLRKWRRSERNMPTRYFGCR